MKKTVSTFAFLSLLIMVMVACRSHVPAPPDQEGGNSPVSHIPENPNPEGENSSANQNLESFEPEENVKEKKPPENLIPESPKTEGENVEGEKPTFDPDTTEATVIVPSEITACGVIHPEKNLPWLAEFIETAKNDTTLRYFGVMWLEHYNGQDLFVVSGMPLIGGAMYGVFDCKGNKVLGLGMDFYNHLKKNIVIYVHPDYPLNLSAL